MSAGRHRYLTRQVAVHDATDRGHQGLADYHAEKGESPGAGSAPVSVRSTRRWAPKVTETHIRNLFGEGRHPDDERLEKVALDAGKSVDRAKKTSQLGRVFARYLGNRSEFIQETAKRYIAYNINAAWLESPSRPRQVTRTNNAPMPPRVR